MIIAVDMDEVLFPLVPELAKWHNIGFGTNLTIEDFATYRFWEAWGGTREEAIVKYFDFMRSDYYRNVQPLPHAFKILKHLKETGHVLFVITARQYELEKISRIQLAKYFPEIFEDILFGNRFSLQGASVKKCQLCQSINAGIMIDDDPKHLSDCAGKIANSILFGKYPWNRDAAGFTRAQDWRFVAPLINTFIYA